MNAPLHKPWTQDQFFAWAGTQEGRYEFDGFAPVGRTGGTANHNRITLNIQAALRARLRGGPCEPLGPDAGVATIGTAIRYPDALVTCSPFAGTALTIPGVVAVFEVVSQSTSRTDRIVKVREYAAVATIRRYVILEATTAGITVFERPDPSTAWTATTLTSDDTLRMVELGIEIPVAAFYERIDFGEASPADDAATP
jgi:Uma2 family endonuclease